MPGTWTASEGKICVALSDGSIEVLETNWMQVRLEVQAEQQRARLQRAEALKEHLAVKREKQREPSGGRGR